MATGIKGHTDDKRQGEERYTTVQPIGSGRSGLDVIPKALFYTDTTSTDLVEAGSDTQSIVATAHGARAGDVIRFVTGLNDRFEATVIDVPDANTMTLGQVLPNAPVVGDEFQVGRHITLTLNSDGALVVTSGPTEFVKDGANQTVTEDTVTPANNEPLPSKLFITKDGVVQPVNKDTGTPANTLAIPVEIVSGSGTEINITAGDINIQSSHLGASFDSMRIGDGTNLLDVLTHGVAVGTLTGLGVFGSDGTNWFRLLTDNTGRLQVSGTLTAAGNLATEAKQDDAITLLTSLDGKDFATQTTLNALLTAFNSEDFATQTTLNALLTAFNAEDFASQTTLAALLAAFSAEDFATQTTLDALLTAFNAEDFATQTTLAAQAADIALLEGRLPGSFTPPELFDYADITYVAAGNGAGEIETVVYKSGGSGGATVATLTLTYDANDRISSVART